jgi:hypothetical protein
MKYFARTLSIAAFAGVLASGLSGCLSMQSQSTIDGITGSNQPFTEAYIEYPGPQRKWSGPSSFILHVQAKDAGNAQISVTPNLFDDRDGSTSGRLPASAHGVPGEVARTRLAQLYTALQGQNQNFRGCMYPVRVRMIRADGALMEKVGCRSAMGWSHTASEAVDYFITAAVGGTSGPKIATGIDAVSEIRTRAPASAIDSSGSGAVVQKK